MKEIKNIDIVIPLYNPPEGWATNLVDNFTQLETSLSQYNINIILVNDGSAISSYPDLKNMILLENESNMGKGYSIRAGVQSSKADVVIYTDIDFPYTLESMVKMVNILIEGSCDIVVGVRDEKYNEKIPFQRRLISKSLKWMIRTFIKIPVSDTQAGLKAFKASAKPYFLNTKINRYLFDLEFLKLAAKGDQKICSCPIELRPGIEIQNMPFRVLFSEGLNFLKLVFS